MIFRLLVVAFFLFPATKADPFPDVPEDGCSVCGEGRRVNAPSVDISAFLPPTTALAIKTCGELQEAGYNGYQDEAIDICGFSGADLFASRQLVEVCDCQHTQADLVEEVSDCRTKFPNRCILD